MGKNKDKKKKKEVVAKADYQNQKINFSYEYYDTTNDDYCLSKFSPTQIKTVKLRLKEISLRTFEELNRERWVYHFGEVDWSKTIKPSGFPDSRANNLAPFHFALKGVNDWKTRVFAAYSTGTFYIVWFDLNHEIWP